MKIDEHVESLVRDALHGAVKRDIDRLDASLKAFHDKASRRAATGLLMAVSAYVVLDLYGGQRPSDEQLRALADKVAEEESWSNLTAEEINTYLHTVLGDKTEPPLDPDAGVLMIFIVTGSLLSGRPKPEGQWWFNYLDQVEAALEKASE